MHSLFIFRYYIPDWLTNDLDDYIEEEGQRRISQWVEDHGNNDNYFKVEGYVTPDGYGRVGGELGDVSPTRRIARVLIRVCRIASYDIMKHLPTDTLNNEVALSGNLSAMRELKYIRRRGPEYMILLGLHLSQAVKEKHPTTRTLLHKIARMSIALDNIYAPGLFSYEKSPYEWRLHDISKYDPPSEDQYTYFLVNMHT